MAVGSLVKAIAILRHLAGVSAAPGVNSIARELGLSPSSCHNILKTLVAEEFVDFDTRTKTYSLGTGPMELFRKGPDLHAVIELVRPELEALAAEYSVTSGLWRVGDRRLHLIDVVENDVGTRIHIALGQRLPRYVGAMGRCLAAWDGLSRADLPGIIGSLRWQDPPAADAYWRDMRFAELHGWAADHGHYLRGVATIASVIADGTTARYCITNTMFRDQHDEAGMSRLGDRSARLSREVARRLFADQTGSRRATDKHGVGRGATEERRGRLLAAG
ncbi:IclR family transcriptional regulator [Sphingosinicella terrae]|uniref:IclR family transcriptional regulator n=1 Tax=Sphingosinicella terrae TaxID=2172047 RepID=UPI000E0D258B|nr:helix-turn-helix domain-containing protein [Sphingosinicella terrae]